MQQLTLRVQSELADRLKQVAGSRGQSVNSYVQDVLSAAVDPELAGDAAERVRERLARAGLLETDLEPSRPHPLPERLEKARTAAGRGAKLSDLIEEGRR